MSFVYCTAYFSSFPWCFTWPLATVHPQMGCKMFAQWSINSNEIQRIADNIFLTPFKIVQSKNARRWVGLGTEGWAGGKARQAASHVLPSERQTGSQAEKGFCCSNVTETLGVCCVCCPTFRKPVHMKNTQVREEAKEVAARLGSVHWLRLSRGNCSCIFNE